MPGLTLQSIDRQEELFARAFAAGDIAEARSLYHPDVVYSSPTTRLFGWPRRIQGVEATLEFIQLTIAGCRRIHYELDERAVLPGTTSAYVRVNFDWDSERARLRSTYVVVYRFIDGLIGRQELYYDPGDEPEVL